MQETASKLVFSRSSKTNLTFKKNLSFNSIDGLNIKQRKLNVFDFLKESTEEQPKKNILFDHPYPLIEILSKRKILNNSRYLLKGVMNGNARPLNNTDKKILASQILPSSKMKPQIEAVEICNNKKKPRKENRNKTHPNFRQEGFDHLYFLTSLPKIDKKKTTSYKVHYHNHDTNLCNKEHLFKNTSENFSRNAYKMKELYMSEHFINKIKTDVFGLKYNYKLKKCTELFSK